MLAGGDGGCIWRSTDAGATWQRVAGDDVTDVLFVMSPADVSCYPAVVAHARAGVRVSVLFVGGAGDRYTPGDQWPRAAALAAGARGVMVLSDVSAVTVTPGRDDWDRSAIVAAWSKALDVPAEEELVRQIVAAIRLTRPAVVAFGPYAGQRTGREAESRLVADLARRAAELAGRDDAFAEQAKVGLRPWTPRRVFAGSNANSRWTAPWDRSSTADRRTVVTTTVDAAWWP